MADSLYEQIVKNKPYLFWDVADKENLSIEAVVEAVLNYGDVDDFNRLTQILSLKQVADIFFHKIQGPRNNFKKPTINFFGLYFTRHVPEYSKH